MANRAGGEPLTGSAGPLIVACLRHADPRPEVDPVGGAVRRYPAAAVASASELAALELALRVAEAWHGHVLAVTAGPPAADGTLREALAVGAAALRVDWPDADYITDLAEDEHGLAAALAGAVRERNPALVLCGDRSADRGTGALPAFLAHELGAAQALGLVSLAADGSQLLAERRLTAGRRELLRIPVPAVCSVEAAGVRLRRASLGAALAAARAAIPAAAISAAAIPATPTAAAAPRVASAAVPAAAAAVAPRVRAGAPRRYSPRTREVPPAPAGSARQRLLALSGALAHREPPALIGPVDSGRAASELLAYLRRSGYAARSQEHQLTEQDGGDRAADGGDRDADGGDYAAT